MLSTLTIFFVIFSWCALLKFDKQLREDYNKIHQRRFGTDSDPPELTDKLSYESLLALHEDFAIMKTQI